MDTGSRTPGRTRTRPMPPGSACSPPGAGPADSAYRAVDVRPAPCRAQRGADRAGAERGGHRVPVGSRPGTQPHRSGAAWTVRTVATILANARYTGHQVWNRQRTDIELVDPADVALGHRDVQRWNLPDGWVISARPAHEALVSEADFIAVQGISAARG